MSIPTDKSVPHEFFDDIFRKSPDPWDYTCSSYEIRKFRTTMRCLPKERFQNAFEIGCAIGVLTLQLAKRCDKLLAIDYSEVGLGEARKRCKGLSNVQFKRMQIPKEMPQDKFDLILFSEVGCYLTMADLRETQLRLVDLLRPDGYLLLVHYRHKLDSFHLNGDIVHDLFIKESLPGMKYLGDPRKRRFINTDVFFRNHKHYRADLFQRVNAKD